MVECIWGRAGVHTPFYCFAWLFRWSRTNLVADQRKARSRSERQDRYTRHEVTAPRVGACPAGPYFFLRAVGFVVGEASIGYEPILTLDGAST